MGYVPWEGEVVIHIAGETVGEELVGGQDFTLKV